MKLFLYNENVIDRPSRYRKISNFSGVRLFNRNRIDSFDDDYQYFLKQYDLKKSCHPKCYLLISEYNHTANYNSGFIIGSDCFKVYKNNNDYDIVFDSDEIPVLSYIDDFANSDNNAIISRSSNFVLSKYLEASSTEIIRYNFSNVDSRIINRKNVLSVINGQRSDISVLLAPVSSVVKKDDVLIFRFDTYNPNYGTKDLLSNDSSTYPVYISVDADNPYCFKFSYDDLNDPDVVTTRGDFYALALPYDKSLTDKRMSKYTHKDLSDHAAFNVDTFIFDNGTISDNGKASSNDYSFAEIVNAIEAGQIYHHFYEQDPDKYARYMNIFYDKEDSEKKKRLKYQMMRQEISDLENYKDMDIRSECVHGFDIHGGHDGKKSKGTMLLLPDQNGKYLLSKFGVGVMGHQLWSGRGDIVRFNNDQIPDNVRTFHFGDDNKLHFKIGYVLSGFDHDEIDLSEARQVSEIINSMDDRGRTMFYYELSNVRDIAELDKYSPINNTGIKYDAEHEMSVERDRTYGY